MTTQQKIQKLEKKITDLLIKKTKAAANIVVNERRRTLFGNQELNRQKRNAEAHLRNIDKEIDFNRRKIQKLHEEAVANNMQQLRA